VSRRRTGVTAVYAAGGNVYAKRSAGLVALVPPGVVTVTSTVPDPAGLVAVICVAVLPVNTVAAAVPNLTAVAPLKLVPVITTEVPPPIGPLFGATETTNGAGV
jgi:hypothetical protein